MTEQNYPQDEMFAIVAHDTPGLVTKITSLLGRRGFDLQSITTGKAKNCEQMRMTVKIKGNAQRFWQVPQQLFKVVETVGVTRIDRQHGVECETALFKINATAQERTALLPLVEAYAGHVVDENTAGLIVQLTGTPQTIDGFIAALGHTFLVDVARSGAVAMNGLQDDSNI